MDDETIRSLAAEGRAWTMIRITIPAPGSALAVLPVIILREPDGRDRLALEFLDYAQEAWISGSKEEAIASTARTIGRLWDYFRATGGSVIGSGQELYSLCRRYLSARYHGTIDPETGDCPFGLWWRRIRATTLLNDRRELQAFFTHAATRSGHLGFLGKEVSLFPDRKLHPELSRLLQTRRAGLLAHISQNQGKKPSHAPVRLPSGIVVSSGLRNSESGRGHPPEEQVDAIIRRTPHPMQRMLLIHAAYGGPRMSEQLHMWIDDVLPPDYRTRLFPGTRTDAYPVVVIAHPTESKWTGRVGHHSRTRATVLDELGLRERHLLPKKNAQKVGWKGYAFDNQALQIGLTYWTDPDRAREYVGLYGEVLDERRKARSAANHPYLHVNMDPRSSHYGQPYTMKALQKMFHRACERAGIQPHRDHANMHALRSFYAEQVRRMVGSERVHVCLHQRWAGSAEHYGHTILGTHQALASAAARKSTTVAAS